MSDFKLNPPLTPCALSQNELFQKKLSIPIYQRLFVWDEEQIDKLLKDLKNAATSSADAYSIGIVTVVEDKDGTWEIVDGQQRLTFLTLFGAECIRRGVDKNDEWKNFVESKEPLGGKSLLRISYFGRPEDEEDIRVLADRAGDVSKIGNPNIRKFHECFERIVGNELSTLSSYVYGKTSFLVSELPTSYSALDLNRFFEKMNAAGRQLEPEDVVKGKYFPCFAPTWNACMDFNKKYEQPTSEEKVTQSDGSINTLKGILASEEPVEKESTSEDSVDRDSTQSILKPAVFLLHVLRLAVDESVSVSLDPDKLVKTFAAVCNENAADSKGCFMLFCEEMQKYRTWLDKNIIWLRYDDGERRTYFFRVKDETDKEGDDREHKQFEAIRKLKHKQFQAMLYVSSDEKQEWVLEAYKKGCTLEDLKAQAAKRRKSLPVRKEMAYGKIDRYWFWYLDYLLWEAYVDSKDPEQLLGVGKLNETEQQAITNYRFQRNRSIEHLHPQCSNKTWDDSNLHGFGNLAMISASSNSAQNNDGIITKSGRVTDQQIAPGKSERLESIKMLLMFKIAAAKGGWTEEVATEHGAAMYQILSGQEPETTGG